MSKTVHACCVLSGLLVLSAQAEVTNLTVMTFNIWGNGGRSLSKCIEAIRDAGADVVGLQECNAATAQTIASALGFDFLGVSDVSIVSRYPILTSLPVRGGSGVVVALSEAQRISLFNCHLTAYPYGPYSMREGRDRTFVLNQEETTRMPALRALLEDMQGYLVGSSPVFLVGDFNAPSHLDYADYPWPTSLACQQAGLVDAYRTAHPENRTYPPPFAFDDPGITWTPLVSQEPRGAFDRIDFVYHSAGDGLALLEAQELDERNSVSPWPSDHRAVIARYRLAPPPRLAAAGDPIPASGATQVSLTPVLSWLPARDALSHQVYFGKEVLVSQTNQTATIFRPGPLQPGVTYRWRVDEWTPSGVITGEVWSFTTAPVHRYEWSFLRGDLTASLGGGMLEYADATTASLTSFGTTDGVLVPHISGEPATYMHVPAFTRQDQGYRVTFTQSGPNGGGRYINQFTLIWDVLLPSPIGWTPLMNTNPQNANDADFYVDPNGRVGIGAIGYSAAGVIRPGQWYRIAFAADLATGQVTYYVNGVAVHQGTAALDGRHSLYSNVDPGPDLLLFNENDTTGVYTHELLVSSFAFTDRTLSAEEMQALGGPNADGIFVHRLPPLTMIRAQDQLILRWPGSPTIKLQRTLQFDPPEWEDVPGTQGAASYTVSLTNAVAFYRLRR